MKLRKRHNVALEDISPVAKKIFLAAERVCVPDPVTCFTFEACRKTRKCRPVQCICVKVNMGQRTKMCLFSPLYLKYSDVSNTQYSMGMRVLTLWRIG